MRIFAKKALRFRGGDKTVSVAALSFANVPDWVQKDPLFGLASAEGTIEIISGKADERRVEKDITTKKSLKGKAANKSDEHGGDETSGDTPAQSGEKQPGDVNLDENPAE